jgi:hypothetical protein
MTGLGPRVIRGGQAAAGLAEQLPHQDLLVVDGPQRPGGAAGSSPQPRTGGGRRLAAGVSVNCHQE